MTPRQIRDDDTIPLPSEHLKFLASSADLRALRERVNTHEYDCEWVRWEGAGMCTCEQNA